MTKPVAYFQLEFFGGSPLHCQVGSQHKDEEGVFPLYDDSALQAAIAAEREACAAICDEYSDDPVYCAAAIRARGDSK